MLSTDNAGHTALRFSYNLLTTADYDPPLDADVDDTRLPLGEAGRRLAHRVSDLFHELRTSVLIPESALLIWDNQRMLHARSEYADRARHLTRFWAGDRTARMIIDDLRAPTPMAWSTYPDCRRSIRPTPPRAPSSAASPAIGTAARRSSATEPDIDELFDADRPDYPEGSSRSATTRPGRRCPTTCGRGC